MPKPQPKKSGSEEFFFLDADGKKRDAELHNAILDDGDHEAAKRVSDKIRARILGKREQQKQWAAAKLRALTLLKWDESKHPRVPAGSPEGGEFGSGGGGSDDDLGSMALGGEDRFKTPSTRKVDALRDEMGVKEADIPFEHRQALDMYTADSTGFNKAARSGHGTDSAEIENLDTLIGSHKLPRDMTVYRTVGWQRTKNILDHVGDAFSDPAFMSTTLDKSKIDKPGSYIEIQVPKGSHAFPVGSLSNFPEEAEILFPRGSRLQIISHEPRSENTERFVARLVS